MKREYWLIIITYMAMQLSGLIGVPIVSTILTAIGQDPVTAKQDAVAYWTLLSFIAGLLMVLWILRTEMSTVRSGKLTARETVTWGIIGFFFALLAQFIGIQIESLLGIEAGSENTEFIIEFIDAYPFIIVTSSIAGPILEEIVFRKVIFGSLYQKTNFWIAGIASSLIFASLHLDFTHIILYTFSGLAFAYLYVKTGRILVPIIAHVLFNTFVVVIQFMARNEMAATGSIFGG